MRAQAATAVSIRDRSAFACNLADANDLSEVGNKAYNLAKMIKLGVNVPRGFVLKNSAFLRFLDANGIDPAEASQKVVRGASIPREILEEALGLVESLLRVGPLIVRSSAIGEDGARASFAGQLDSISGVRTEDEIPEALLACWASYWNERALFYQEARNIRLRGMGVIIQSQAASRVSGVLFTQAPKAAGTKDEFYLEYCSGSGEALVSGRVNPGRVRLSKTDCRYAIDQYAEERNDVDEQLLFDPQQSRRIASAAAIMEKHFDGPQDIEWTIDGRGELFFVQSRPITVAADSPREILWSNANVNENFPGPITPFLYSIASEGYYHYFRNLALAFGLSASRVGAMEHPLRHIVGVHHSRIYYNLTSIHSVLRMAPFGETLAEFFNDFTGASRMAPRSPAGDSPRWRQWLELCTAGLKTTWQYAFLTVRVEEFERRADRFASATRPEDLEKRYLLSLRDDLRGFMDIRCHHWTNPSLADAASMVSYGTLKLLLRNAYGPSESARYNNLLAGLGVVSAQPVMALWDLSRKILAQPELAHWFSTTDSAQILSAVDTRPELAWLRTDLQDYLETWGFRFSGELMLTLPSFQEEPIPLVDLLKRYLPATGPGPAEAIQRLEAERRSETSRILEDFRRTKHLSRVPRFLQAPVVRLVLGFAHRAITLRERARSKQALLYSRCRRIALAIGKQLVHRGLIEDAAGIFFLTYSEVDELLSGHAMFPDQLSAQIAVRKQANERASELSAPGMFNWTEGEYLSRTARAVSAEGDDAVNKTSLNSAMTGIGACGGKVAARAAVLESMSDAHMLQQGDILVTRQTDPGWAPIFFLIRGLVIERGGMLSHGAIIAREFGLPCVVGVDRATSRIPHGAMVSVDGDRGNVRIVD